MGMGTMQECSFSYMEGAEEKVRNKEGRGDNCHRRLLQISERNKILTASR